MKRLTYRDKSLPRKNDRGEIVEAYSDYDARKIINRLAAYEDTGFEPEEIISFDRGDRYTPNGFVANKLYGKPLYHWGKLSQAEKEGRLVVLPCKAGDVVYAITSFQTTNTPTVIQTTVRSVTIYDDHIAVSYNWKINPNDDCGVWGKSVFSSWEEAQAELGRRYAY